MATIIQVARSAGVSTATVSRTLSEPGLVSENTRERVMHAVKLLGYSPNSAARALRTLRTSKLLVSVPDISNPFFAKVIRGAEEMAREAGFGIVLGDTRHDPELENQYAKMLSRREVDGLLFLGHRIPTLVDDHTRWKGTMLPVVNGCEYRPDQGVSSVHIDNAAAAADMMQYLIDLGHRHIAVISGPMANPINRDRLDGALRRIDARRMREGLEVRAGDFSVESGVAQARSILAETKSTAIFCFNDEMAMGALAAVRAAGLSCPRDVSVVGFDDIRFSRFLEPALTTIKQPSATIGRLAVQMLIDIIRGEQTEIKLVTLSHRLVVRASTAPPAAARPA